MERRSDRTHSRTRRRCEVTTKDIVAEVVEFIFRYGPMMSR